MSEVQPTPPIQPQSVYVNPSTGRAPLPQRNLGTAYLLMIFTLVGVAGIQHFYMGKIGRGVLWVLTWGVFGIGSVVDLFTLPSQMKTINARRAVGIS
jgi:hypothetical protein